MSEQKEKTKILNNLQKYISSGKYKSALKIINENKYPELYSTVFPKHNNNTLLIMACENNDWDMRAVALKLIASGHSNPGHANDDGETALMYSGMFHSLDVAKAIVATGDFNPSQINRYRHTALNKVCNGEGWTDVALAIINTGQSIPENVGSNGMTALHMACWYKMSRVALALIDTGRSMPELVDNNGNTALMNACRGPGVMGAFEDSNMEEVALALIATGRSNPQQINRDKSTALIYACANNMPAVALALIATGESNVSVKDDYDYNAYDYAVTNNMRDVIRVLETYNSEEYNKHAEILKTIDVFDPIMGVELTAYDFLNNNDNYAEYPFIIKQNNKYIGNYKKLSSKYYHNWQHIVKLIGVGGIVLYAITPNWFSNDGVTPKPRIFKLIQSNTIRRISLDPNNRFINLPYDEPLYTLIPISDSELTPTSGGSHKRTRKQRNGNKHKKSSRRFNL